MIRIFVPLDPNRPFAVDRRYDDALRRVRVTPPHFGIADAPVPAMPDGNYQPGLAYLMLRIASARPEDLPQLYADIQALYMQPGAHRTGEALIRAAEDAAEAGGDLRARREILNDIAPIAKSDPLQLAADEFGLAGAALVGGGAGAEGVESKESTAASSRTAERGMETGPNPEARLQAIQQTKGSHGLRSDLSAEWFDRQGELLWPPNEGASGRWQTTTLQPGTIIDRYGTANGSYFSPRGDTI